MKHYTQMLRDLREDKRLSQTKVAELIGTSQQYYSKYETGKYKIPFQAMMILADTYHVSLDYIAGRTECEKGVDALNSEFLPGYSAGKLLSDFDALGPTDRKTIIEHIRFLKAQKRIGKKL